MAPLRGRNEAACSSLCTSRVFRLRYIAPLNLLSSEYRCADISYTMSPQDCVVYLRKARRVLHVVIAVDCLYCVWQEIVRLSRAYMQRQARRREKTYYRSGTDGEAVIGPYTRFDSGDNHDGSAWERLKQSIGLTKSAARIGEWSQRKISTPLTESKFQIATGAVVVGAAVFAFPGARKAVVTRLNHRLSKIPLRRVTTTFGTFAVVCCALFGTGYWRRRQNASRH